MWGAGIGLPLNEVRETGVKLPIGELPHQLIGFSFTISGAATLCRNFGASCGISIWLQRLGRPKSFPCFHLEEKASALSVPGITVSNNKKKMLRDAQKKYEEYRAEYQKYPRNDMKQEFLQIKPCFM